jgi:hypothetical protein
MAALCCALLLLAGCGPERGGEDAALMQQTAQIARDFAASGDLEAARARLNELDVANGSQWLIYVAEQAISSNEDPELSAALVRLSESLGLESATIEDFALRNNLLEGLSAAVEGATAPVSAGEVVVAPTAAVAPQSAAAPAAVAETEDAAEGAADTAADPAPGSSAESDQESDAETGSAALPEPTASPTPDASPLVRATLSMNVRSGPDTTYDIVDLFDDDEELTVVGKNADGTWWQVELADGRLGWVYGQLVEQVGAFDGVAVAANIPPPPEPTAAPPPAEEAPPAAAAPAAEAPAAEEPPAEEAAPAADPAGTPNFSLVSRRLWSKEENGGCAGQHLLRIIVTDANGVRLNGVALQGIYVGDVLVTGDQGKGEGVIEYDLHGSGEGFFVLRNNDGREATSDRAEGFTTRSRDIPKDVLIEAGYCSNSADCDIFYGSYGCQGHHSYEAIFQRNY